MARNIKLRPARQKNRFSHLPRIFGRTLVAVLPAVLLVTFLTVHFSRSASRDVSAISSSEVSFTSQTAAGGSSIAPRPVFRYSVVAGGVRNAQELEKAAAADPIVGKHYSDFKIGKSHTIQLDRPVAMYVSYRRNNRVYWTRNKMVIPAGESLISDGENLARVRCGNRLSPVAAKPVAAIDPDGESMETPEFVPPLLASLLPGESAEMSLGSVDGSPSAPGPSSAPTSKSGSPYTPNQPPLLGPGGPPHSIPIPSPPPPPPVKTPEPGSLGLLFAGAAFMALLAVITVRRDGCR